MPQPRRYATRALQQAAYRKRQAAARDEQLRAKGLPALPAPPQIPGRVRWRSAIETAGAVLEQTAAEMQDYYADARYSGADIRGLLAELQEVLPKFVCHPKVHQVIQRFLDVCRDAISQDKVVLCLCD